MAGDSSAARRSLSLSEAYRRAQDQQSAPAPDHFSSTPAASSQLGIGLSLEGRLDETAQALAAAARHASDEPRVFAELGYLYRRLGRKAEAMQNFLKALRLDPSQVDVWLNSASLSYEAGHKFAAEQAYLQVLERDPTRAEAAVRLGYLNVERRRYKDAARFLSLAVELGAHSAPIFSCLGQTRYVLGEFSKADAVFAQAVRLDPGHVETLRRYARTRLILTVIAESVERAIEVYREVAGEHAEDIFTVCSSVFHLLGANGPREAAIRLGEALLRRKPGDPVIAFHLDALMGHAYDRAPNRYLTACFDRLAPQFEKHLVDVLDYQVPAKIHSMLAGSGEKFENILDLGCGTGLAAPLLSGLGGKLTGVDISPGMLKKAEERGLYARLIEAEAVSFLSRKDATYDLITALDVLIYFGDLTGLFAAVASRLSSGGIFALSHEMTNCDSYRLLPSGRFAHNPRYIKTLSAESFSLVATVASVLRLENTRPVVGRLTLLRRS